MDKSTVISALEFVFLVLLQALVFNRLTLFSVGLAFVFIYFIIKLPADTNASKVIFLSFLMGTCVDIFSDTPGLNALACTCLGGARHTVIRLYMAREDDMVRQSLTMRTLGVAVFCKYLFTMSLIYCILVFLIESLSFFNPGLLLMRIFASSLLTSLLIVVLDSLMGRLNLNSAA